MDWKPLADIVSEHSRFVLATHVRPDGDALGSVLGLACWLRDQGKDVRVVLPSPTPHRYDFLDPDGSLFEHIEKGRVPEGLDDREVLIILDLSSWGQLATLADWARGFPGKRLVIDHHVSEDEMGAVVLKDTTAEATGRLVLDAIETLGGPLSPRAATGLFTAIAMDTGWFRHASTSPETLHAAARLMEAGADLVGIHRQLYLRDRLQKLKLIGQTIDRLQTDLDGRIVYTTISREDVARVGASPQETEDLVDLTVSIAGVDVGLLFYELANGDVKLSARSRSGFDCARLARIFNGGGHKAAAGATLTPPLSQAVEITLKLVRQMLLNPDDAPPTTHPCPT